MEYSQLGTTDIKVSKICLGTMTWGQQNNEEDGHQQMDYAIDQGVNFFDTAELYAVPATPETQGKTEEIIGSWFASRKNRDRIILASKIAGPSNFTKHIRTDKDFNKINIAEAVEGSLKRLQTDYIDLYQVHWPARKTNFFSQRGYSHDVDWTDNILEVLEGLESVQKEGKIRYFGISNETPWGLMSYLKYSAALGKPRCMSVQNPYNLLNRTYEIGLAEMSIREKCGLLAYSPLAFGLLSGKYHRKEDNQHSRMNLYPNLARYSGKRTFKIAGKYIKIAKKYNLTPTQLSLAFVNSRDFVTSNIIGATSLIQLKENIESINVKLDDEIINSINKVHEKFPNPAP